MAVHLVFKGSLCGLPTEQPGVVLITQNFTNDISVALGFFHINWNVFKWIEQQMRLSLQSSVKTLRGIACNVCIFWWNITSALNVFNGHNWKKERGKLFIVVRKPFISEEPEKSGHIWGEGSNLHVVTTFRCWNKRQPSCSLHNLYVGSTNWWTIVICQIKIHILYTDIQSFCRIIL